MTRENLPHSSINHDHNLSIFNELEDGFFKLDISGNFCFVNQAMSRIFGYSEEELLGMNNREYMDKKAAKEIYKSFNRVYTSGQPEKTTELEIIKKSGERIIAEISLSLIKNERSEITGFQGILRDITSRKKAEHRLKLSEMRYRSILEEINELYFETDSSGIFTFFNSAVEHLLEFSAEELMGNDPTLFMDGKNSRSYLNSLKRVKESGKTDRLDLDLKTKSGRQLVAESKVMAIKNSDGELIGYRGVIRDITDRKWVEKELIHYKNHLEEMVINRTQELSNAKIAAEKANQSRSEFLANISHELRTPLHSILSFSRFGMEKIDQSNSKHNFHYYQRINQAGHRLLFLVNDLIDLAVMESGKTDYQMVQNDLLAIVNFVVQGFSPKINEKKLQVVIQKPEISTLIRCDSNKMTQVIQNLLSNAIRYSPEKSSISVFFQSPHLADESDAKAGLMVSIIDQGIGIPEDELELIFETFKQSSRTKTGAGGTGLGLAICKEIIHAHQGTIWAENSATGGAVIRFTIPH